MKYPKIPAVLAAFAMAATLAACGPSAKAETKVDPATDDRTLTVWVMTGGPGETDLVEKINATFKQKHPKVNVKVEVQQWANISTKLTTALATDTPPDIVEIGNTQVALYAYSGALADLTGHKGDFEGSDGWLKGLEGPATYDGKLYATPLYGGTKVVMYDKQMFAKAGISAPPTSFDELLDVCGKLKAKDPRPNFAPFYMPGKYWVAGTPLVWGAGGDIATQAADGAWQGTMASPESIKGLTSWQKFQNTCSTPGSVGTDTAQPQQYQVFADGNAAMELVRSREPGYILEANPKMKDRLGYFIFPGYDKGTTMPVMITGSDIAIASKSPNQDLALDWLKIVTSKDIQHEMALAASLLPINPSFVDPAELDPMLQLSLEAGKNSRPAPAAAGWTTLEADGTLGSLYSAIADGKDIETSAKDFDKHSTDVLNSLE